MPSDVPAAAVGPETVSPNDPRGAPSADWSRMRLHIVTGKGGTGKTTIASALALCLASLGRRVLLAEVEGRQGISAALDVSPLSSEETLMSRVSGGGEIWGISVDPKAALIEYLRLFYRLGRAGNLLERMGAIDFATTIAPGVRDVLSIGKVYEAVGRADGRVPSYDAVVLDAPPTGRIVPFLSVNTEVADLAKVGPIRSQADSVTRLLRSPLSAVHLVTLLEEMPVQETLDAVEELRAVALPIGAIVVNQARDALFGPEAGAAVTARTVEAAAVGGRLAAAGLPHDQRTVIGLLEQARGHLDRLALEDRQLEALDAVGVPVYLLRHLLDPTGAGSVRELAQNLADQAQW